MLRRNTVLALTSLAALGLLSACSHEESAPAAAAAPVTELDKTMYALGLALGLAQGRAWPWAWPVIRLGYAYRGGPPRKSTFIRKTLFWFNFVHFWTF